MPDIKKSCTNCRQGPIFNQARFPEAICMDIIEKRDPKFKLSDECDCPMFREAVYK